jgi:hypothetical protein
VKYWPHWSAILKENESGQKYAVDRWPFDQGENAAVVKVEDSYIKDRFDRRVVCCPRRRSAH